jgi:transposase InsO family protein
MDLKVEFIARLKGGERMTDLCGQYGISRKTGHRLQKRFERMGVVGLLQQSRAPKTIPHRTPPEVVAMLLEERKAHPSWGPKKLKCVLQQRLGREFPSPSTIGSILLREGLAGPRKPRHRYHAAPSTLTAAERANHVWCVDYKGQFRLGDQSYCYPLTVTDQFSRYILGCEGMAAISDEASREVFHDIFGEYGLPQVIRSDNGAPFASVGLAGLTKLSAYWLRLGIRLERIRPAHPEENGRHERMHRTLKRETTRPARHNLLQQQERFDEFREEFNQQRPHEALEMRRPAEAYEPSSRPYPHPLPEPSYPTHDDVVIVNRYGHLSMPGHKNVYLSVALAGQPVGVREEDDGRWLVTFTQLNLGHIEPDSSFTPLTSLPPEAH